MAAPRTAGSELNRRLRLLWVSVIWPVAATCNDNPIRKLTETIFHTTLIVRMRIDYASPFRHALRVSSNRSELVTYLFVWTLHIEIVGGHDPPPRKRHN